MRGIASYLAALTQAATGTLICAAAWAQNAKPFAAPEAASAPPAGGVTGLGEVTFALAIVLAAIFGLAWMMRRVRGFGRRSGAALDVIAEVPLGPKERAVLIRVGNTQLLVGVTPQSVNALHVLTEPVPIDPPTVDPNSGDRPSFRTLLMRSLAACRPRTDSAAQAAKVTPFAAGPKLMSEKGPQATFSNELGKS